VIAKSTARDMKFVCSQGDIFLNFTLSHMSL
jgi:hypothetical protein